MDKEKLERIIIMAVEYYFKGLTVREAINKAVDKFNGE